MTSCITSERSVVYVMPPHIARQFDARVLADEEYFQTHANTWAFCRPVELCDTWPAYPVDPEGVMVRVTQWAGGQYRREVFRQGGGEVVMRHIGHGGCSMVE